MACGVNEVSVLDLRCAEPRNIEYRILNVEVEYNSHLRPFG